MFGHLRTRNRSVFTTDFAKSWQFSIQIYLNRPSWRRITMGVTKWDTVCWAPFIRREISFWRSFSQTSAKSTPIRANLSFGLYKRLSRKLQTLPAESWDFAQTQMSCEKGCANRSPGLSQIFGWIEFLEIFKKTNLSLYLSCILLFGYNNKWILPLSVVQLI